MLNLGDILELVNDGLNDRAFPEQQAIAQRHKAMVADQTGEVYLPLNLYFILVVGFEIPVTRLMKVDQNRHVLAKTQTV
ncbi:hypothetical protein [Nostoc sp.]|uniref:hypothetical protein n=1 Tax=Nostoc sp. TaxID=1180 RepID=UPI002FFA35B7